MRKRRPIGFFERYNVSLRDLQTGAKVHNRTTTSIRFASCEKHADLLTMAGLPVPGARVIDGQDQSPFLSGEQEKSNREGFLYWNGEKLYGVKWQNFKLVLVEQKYFTDPALPLGFPRIVNLVTDPKEREPFNQVYLHTWTLAHFGRLMKEFATSVQASRSSPRERRLTSCRRRKNRDVHVFSTAVW